MSNKDDLDFPSADWSSICLSIPRYILLFKGIHTNAFYYFSLIPYQITSFLTVSQGKTTATTDSRVSCIKQMISKYTLSASEMLIGIPRILL